jgi:hypothetical protein
MALAVSPAPDGGYAGNNTAEGTSALFSLTSGADNTATFTLVYRFAIALAQCLDFQELLLNVSGALNNTSGAAT